MTGYFLNDSSYLRVWTERCSDYVEWNFIKIQSPKTLDTEMSMFTYSRIPGFGLELVLTDQSQFAENFDFIICLVKTTSIQVPDMETLCQS